jgi:hypothetical protein
MFGGRGEYGMFYSPALSKHFLRMGSESYTLMPGLPNLFSEPMVISGHFAGVVEGYATKSSAQLANTLKGLEGTGLLVRPYGGWGEAEALLSPGTKMLRMPGRFWADIGGGIVRINRYVPEATALAMKAELGVDLLTGSTRSSIPLSSFSYTPYLPLGFLPTQGGASKPLPGLSRRYSRPGPPSYLPPALRPPASRPQGSSRLEPPSFAPPSRRQEPPSPATPRKGPPSLLPPSRTPPSLTPPSRAPPSRPPYKPPTYRPPKAPPYRPPPGFTPPSRPPWGPGAMPRISPEPGFVASRRRGYRGERRTYPVRDPLSLAEDLMSPPPKDRRRRRRKGGDLLDLLP